MRTTLVVLLLLSLLPATLFALPADLESFYIRNLTGRPIRVILQYEELQFFGSWVEYQDTSGETIAAASVTRMMGEQGIIIPPEKNWKIFHLHKTQATAALSPEVKFKGVIADLTVADEAGKVLLTYADLTAESFVEFGVSKRDNDYAIVIWEQRTE